VLDADAVAWAIAHAFAIAGVTDRISAGKQRRTAAASSRPNWRSAISQSRRTGAMTDRDLQLSAGSSSPQCGAALLAHHAILSSTLVIRQALSCIAQATASASTQGAMVSSYIIREPITFLISCHSSSAPRRPHEERRFFHQRFHHRRRPSGCAGLERQLQRLHSARLGCGRSPMSTLDRSVPTLTPASWAPDVTSPLVQQGRPRQAEDRLDVQIQITFVVSRFWPW